MIPKQDGDDFNTCLNLQQKLFDEVLFEWKRNYGSRKHPDYRPLCTFVRKFVRGKLRTNYDLHYVNPVLSDGGSADVAFYVLKYMMKPSNRVTRLRRALTLNLSQDEFEDIWKIVKPRHFESESLGLGLSREMSPKVYEHLRKGIDLSKHQSVDPIPSYFSPLDGSSHPLAKYYKNNPAIFTMQDFFDFFYASKKADKDNVVIKDDVHLSQLIKRVDDFDKKVHQLDERLSATNLDDLYE